MSVSLVKGQKISLEKDGKLSNIFMGLGWDVAKPKNSGGLFVKLKGILGGGGPNGGSIDLDASCVTFANGQPRDIVYFGALQSRDGSIQHTGDNLTGEGEGDDEVIRVKLNKIPADVDTIVFTVSSYRGQNFREIENAFCRIVDETTGKELARYDISGGGDYTGLIMAKLYRHNGEWKFQAVGESMQAKTIADMITPIKNIL